MVLAETTPKLLAGYKTQRRMEKAAPATINKELQLLGHAFQRGDARMGLVQRGVDLYKVQRLLGHKTSLMTQRYAHHAREFERRGKCRG